MGNFLGRKAKRGGIGVIALMVLPQVMAAPVAVDAPAGNSAPVVDWVVRAGNGDQVEARIDSVKPDEGVVIEGGALKGKQMLPWDVVYSIRRDIDCKIPTQPLIRMASGDVIFGEILKVSPDKMTIGTSFGLKCEVDRSKVSEIQYQGGSWANYPFAKSFKVLAGEGGALAGGSWVARGPTLAEIRLGGVQSARIRGRLWFSGTTNNGVNLHFGHKELPGKFLEDLAGKFEKLKGANQQGNNSNLNWDFSGSGQSGANLFFSPYQVIARTQVASGGKQAFARGFNVNRRKFVHEGKEYQGITLEIEVVIDFAKRSYRVLVDGKEMGSKTLDASEEGEWYPNICFFSGSKSLIKLSDIEVSVAGRPMEEEIKIAEGRDEITVAAGSQRLTGKLQSLEGGKWNIKTGFGEMKVPVERVRRIALGNPVKAVEGALHMVLLDDGSRISGRLTGVEGQILRLEPDWRPGNPLELPFERISEIRPVLTSGEEDNTVNGQQAEIQRSE